MKENISEYVSELFLSPPPPLKKKNYIQGDAQHAGFELLGLKRLPALTRLQAQELSPYEVGEQLRHDSLDNLMSCPALVCGLRRLDAFASLRKLLPHDYPGNLCVLMSPTPEMAFRQASLFFFEHEMIPGRFVECHIKDEIYQI